MGTISKVRELQDKVDSLEVEHRKGQNALREMEKCKAAITRMEEAPKLKKQGNFLIVLGVLLIVFEIMLLTETFITGYSDFDTVDVMIIGAVLIWGIVRKVKGFKEYRQIINTYESAEKLKKELMKAEADVEKYRKVGDEYKKAKEELAYYTTYRGNEWDLNSVCLTESLERQLANDLADLVRAIAFTNDKAFIVDNWFSLACMEDFMRGASPEVCNKLGNSTNWIVVVTSLAMSVFSLEIMRLQWGRDETMDMEKALSMSKAGLPKTEEQKEYFELLKLAVPKIVNEVHKRIDEVNKK